MAGRKHGGSGPSDQPTPGDQADRALMAASGLSLVFTGFQKRVSHIHVPENPL